MTGIRYAGDAAGYRLQQRKQFQQDWEQGLVLAPSGGNWIDSGLNATSSTVTGYGDAWSFGYTSQWQGQLYGNDINAFNRDSYFYSGGQIAGSATFAYVTGAGLTRFGAFASGFAPTATYVAGTGATAYGGYQLYEHTSNAIQSWDTLSGPQRLSAVGVPFAGAVGGYAGYKSVPAETIFQWQSAGASSRAYTNRIARSLWADEAGTIQTGYGAFGWGQGPQSPMQNIGTTVSQKQFRHIFGRNEWLNRGQGGYFNTIAEAQTVLNAAHSGEAKILTQTVQGHVLIEYAGIIGFNNNVANGFLNQPTNTFLIKGSAAPSVVPTTPGRIK